MRCFIVASHGPLAAAILQSAAFIIGDDLIQQVRVIQVEKQDSSDTVRQKTEQALSSCSSSNEVIAMTDIFGGNVTNILMEYVNCQNLCIVTGMNLGMVLEALLSDQSVPVDQLTEILVGAGKNGVKHVNVLMDQSDNKGDEI